MGAEFDGLISKKKLLEKYGISYGALYRWKRKGLIPDEWFIRKSTSTGQETFFPEELINERIELIMNEKETSLLDDLSQTINKNESNISYLLIKSVFGDKKFTMSDIQQIEFISGDQSIDITDAIKVFVKENSNE